MSIAGWRAWRARKRAQGGGEGDMSFLEHLEELRRVIIFSVLVSCVGATLAWFVSDTALHFLTRDVGPVYFKTLMEAFMVKFKLAMALGFVAVLPLILYRIWRFVVPALLMREKRYIYPMVASSVSLFYAGIAFAIWIMMPLLVKFFMQYRVPGQLEPILMVGDYLGFVAKLCLAFGVVFQLPLVVVLLSLAGIINPDTMGRQWRYAIVLLFFVGGVATPGTDVISQVALTVPLVVLFFGSVVVSKILVRRAASREAREAASVELEPGGRISP